MRDRYFSLQHSPKGARISIPAGALQTTDKTVRLELKEAFSFRDIIKGKLLTIGNEQALSSGGMLYLAPANDILLQTDGIMKATRCASKFPDLQTNRWIFI